MTNLYLCILYKTISDQYIPEAFPYCLESQGTDTDWTNPSVPLANEASDPIKSLLFNVIIVVQALCLQGSCPANERRRYYVTSSPIGWAHIQNDPCVCNGVKWQQKPSPSEPTKKDL